MEEDFEERRICRLMTTLSPLPIVFAEGQTHIVRYVNPAFCRLVGKERHELVGKSFAEAVPEGCANECIALLDRVFSSGNAEKLAHQEHLQGGRSPLFWSYTAWAVPDEEESSAGIMVLGTDTTIEAIAAQMNQKLILSNVRQHELKEEAANMIRTKDHFIAALSHELRTPLAPILSATQILERRADLPADIRGYVGIIRRNVGLEARLVDDLLDVNRIAHGKLKFQMGLVDLHESIAQVVETYQVQLEEKGLRMSLELKASVATVRGDSVRIQQILWNLLSNAVKFTEVGTITISTTEVENKKIEVKVADNGKGIDPETLPRLFNAFEQGEALVTREFGGLGLGLAISKSLVEMHGGALRAQSEGIGRGATFILTLPKAESDTPQDVVDKGEATPTAPLLADPLAPISKRILLVEDNMDAGNMMKQALDSGGHKVHHAKSVASALRAAGDERFDLLLCDIGLPDGSGNEVVSALRKLNVIKMAVAISGFGMDHDIRKSREAGFDAHLTKPVDLDELDRLIETL